MFTFLFWISLDKNELQVFIYNRVSFVIIFEAMTQPWSIRMIFIHWIYSFQIKVDVCIGYELNTFLSYISKNKMGIKIPNIQLKIRFEISWKNKLMQYKIVSEAMLCLRTSTDCGYFFHEHSRKTKIWRWQCNFVPEHLNDVVEVPCGYSSWVATTFINNSSTTNSSQKAEYSHNNNNNRSERWRQQWMWIILTSNE